MKMSKIWPPDVISCSQGRLRAGVLNTIDDIMSKVHVRLLEEGTCRTPVFDMNGRCPMPWILCRLGLFAVCFFAWIHLDVIHNWQQVQTWWERLCWNECFIATATGGAEASSSRWQRTSGLLPNLSKGHTRPRCPPRFLQTSRYRLCRPPSIPGRSNTNSRLVRHRWLHRLISLPALQLWPSAAVQSMQRWALILGSFWF